MSGHRPAFVALARPLCGGLLLGLLLAACGCEEAQPPGPAFAELQRTYNEALQFEQAANPAAAEVGYAAAAGQAEALLPRLAPGDELLAKTETIRASSAQALARIREMRRKQAAGGAPSASSDPNLHAGASKFASVNLAPPVAAYKPPEAAKPPEGGKPAEGGAATPPVPGEPGQAAPAAPDKPKEPEKPKDVRITKVTFKNGKVLVVNWTFSNLADKAVRFGAPLTGVLNKSGGQLTTIRHTFEAAGFGLNAADPAASTGKHVAPEAFGLQPGESRDLVTVGELSESSARQLGGVSVIVRMSDDRELTDQCDKVDKE